MASLGSTGSLLLQQAGLGCFTGHTGRFHKNLHFCHILVTKTNHKVSLDSRGGEADTASYGTKLQSHMTEIRNGEDCGHFHNLSQVQRSHCRIYAEQIWK